jgi:hypothetical protein
LKIQPHQIKFKKLLMMLLKPEKTRSGLEMKRRLTPMDWFQKPEVKHKG